MMSSRVTGSAVAVSAMRGTPGKVSAQMRQRPVFGAEVVSPLADAMGFVDGDQGDLDAGHHRFEPGRLTRSGAA